MSEKNHTGAEETLPNMSMSRRKVLLGAAAVAATATAGTGSVFAEMDHSHHSMNKNQGVIDSSLDCVKKGQACIEHCIELFKTGDTSVAGCADTVNEMLAMCTAISQMASYNSKQLAELASVCRKTCLACEKECRKHADKHAACKACAESCEACAKECKKIAA